MPAVDEALVARLDYSEPETSGETEALRSEALSDLRARFRLEGVPLEVEL